MENDTNGQFQRFVGDDNAFFRRLIGFCGNLSGIAYLLG
jgi:hypothetical protein